MERDNNNVLGSVDVSMRAFHFIIHLRKIASHCHAIFICFCLVSISVFNACSLKKKQRDEINQKFKARGNRFEVIVDLEKTF